ncbi:hypothetical protein [uncultured Methylobacterium sp.]|uniref:hypothetical protein n=1 Tax=uncultured Methylobacterium sp. TaxID=157278 RepID=UPI0035C9850B
MSFLLRAALVIGTLSYLASMRGGPGSPTGARGGIAELAAAAENAVPAAVGSLPAMPNGPADAARGLSAAWSAMSADARQHLVGTAAAELRRRAGASASRDTLAETDRRAPWRGAEPH